MSAQKLHVIIDGVEIPADEGQTILEAAQAAGIYIPRLCYHPELVPGGHSPAVHREGEREANQRLHDDRNGRHGNRKRYRRDERGEAAYPGNAFRGGESFLPFL